jgi:hypothetical protein
MSLPKLPRLKSYLTKEQIKELKEVILAIYSDAQELKPEPFDDPLAYIYVDEYLDFLEKLQSEIV